MSRFTDDPKRNAQILRALREKEEDLVRKAERLARSLAGDGKRPSDKERQLRNIQEVAEQSASWAEIELFIRYQAARKEISVVWADEAIQELKGLEEIAGSIVSTADEPLIRRVHLEMVRRVLGYTVRWHVWHVEGEPHLQQAKQGGAG